jgi:prepilin-type N-terminal cleavage/methylation domain-containing protein
MHRSRGSSLVEMMVALAIVSLICGIASPSLFTLSRRVALRGAVARIQFVLSEARTEAQLLDHNCGVRFTSDEDGWSYGIYEDMNGNGVRNADIASGVDRLVRPRMRLTSRGEPAFIGFAPDVADPDTSAPIPAGTSPVNFNSSMICSYSPGGGATPGTIYLTDGGELEAAVRSSGAEARITALYYDRATRKWNFEP